MNSAKVLMNEHEQLQPRVQQQDLVLTNDEKVLCAIRAVEDTKGMIAAFKVAKIRKIVPPCAASKRPILVFSAPE